MSSYIPILFLYMTSVLAALPETPGQSKTMYFTGCCDASAAIAITDDLFVIANDEDNILRIYSPNKPGRPISSVDVTAFLNPGKKSPEVDIEAAARIGNQIYWISSHGRNAKGKERQSRHRFFATSVSVTNGIAQLRPVGNFYSRLLNDLAREPQLTPFHLGAAAQRAPKEEGALNIEGLCATPEGHLLLGFRNPVPGKKALVVPLLNPDELIAGRPARFGKALLLDLDGRGVRSIEFWRDHDRYLIVGGASGGTPGSHLYEWSAHGDEKPRLIATHALDSLNPEAAAFYGNRAAEQLLVASDDGTLQIGGRDCKKLKDPKLRRFRAVSFSLDPQSSGQVAPATSLVQP